MRKPRPFAHRPIYYEERLSDASRGMLPDGSGGTLQPSVFSVKAQRKGRVPALSIPMLLSVVLILAAAALLIIFS